jgi:hypothetical protein
MRLELTDEQRQAVVEQPGHPVEVIDPHTLQTYDRSQFGSRGWSPGFSRAKPGTPTPAAELRTLI